jgi:hypothetical protein
VATAMTGTHARNHLLGEEETGLTFIVGVNAPDVPLQVFPAHETLAAPCNFAHVRPHAFPRRARAVVFSRDNGGCGAWSRSGGGVVVVAVMVMEGEVLEAGDLSAAAAFCEVGDGDGEGNWVVFAAFGEGSVGVESGCGGSRHGCGRRFLRAFTLCGREMCVDVCGRRECVCLWVWGVRGG